MDALKNIQGNQEQRSIINIDVKRSNKNLISLENRKTF